METTGKVFKYGDHVDTDVIIPARYLNTTDPKELASHCMEDLDKDFAKNVKNGDIMVAGINFGCGSSREHAPISIKANGIKCIIAKTFARIFFRNAINIGLPILECEAAANDIADGDEVNVDFETGVIKNLTTGKTYQGQPFPPFLQELISADGLISYIASNTISH
jgi:3-isopropylmalate/(R)-2-methylmalate dehydratase small subunit